MDVRAADRIAPAGTLSVNGAWHVDSNGNAINANNTVQAREDIIDNTA